MPQPELFTRSPRNPILTSKDLPYPCKAVCNPAAALVDGQTILMVRAIDQDSDTSRLIVARSDDGETGWTFDPLPLLCPDIDSRWYDDMGCEDPRITWFAEEGIFYIVYVGVSRFGAGVCLASTKDFKTVERRGLLIHPYNKDAAILPRKIDGRYYLLHRPTAGPLENIWSSQSDDLLDWGDPKCVLEEREQPGWDHGKVGCGPVPLELPEGWLMIFHGVQQEDTGWLYRVGLALLKFDQPSRLIARAPSWVFEPKADYELRGEKPGIVFPTGAIVQEDIVRLYYGAADTTVAMATGSLSELRAALVQEADAERPPDAPSL